MPNTPIRKVLIISPHFVPSSTADMQRIRMSLPYYRENGWDAEVVSVNPKYIEMATDPLLFETIPTNLKIHQVAALKKEYTIKVGLGSLALRSMYFIYQKVCELLSTESYDLIFFSTTEYPICLLGRLWKRKFKVPYLIDIQDPWHTDYYQHKPKSERPKKYWFSYRLNKWLEPYAMKECDGLMAVSQPYLDDLNKRYPQLKRKPQAVIPFGYSTIDFELAAQFPKKIGQGRKNLVYAGVLGNHMNLGIRLLFENLKKSEIFSEEFEFYLLGTSYAQKPLKIGEKLAKEYGLEDRIFEVPQRLSPFDTIRQLQAADGLVIFGTDDPSYLGSKLFPYLLTMKPILAFLHSQSYAAKLIAGLSNATVIFFDEQTELIRQKVVKYLELAQSNQQAILNERRFEAYHSKNLTYKQTELFNKIFRDQFL